MEITVLDARKMKDETVTQEYIALQLDFPEHYGKNLDALHDCLTELDEHMIVINEAKELEKLGEYGRMLLRVFRDSSRENEDIILMVNE